jgi:hypothetical protein
MAKERVGKRQRNHDGFLKKSVTSFFQMYETKQNIKKQLACYRNMEGLFADPATFLVAKEMPAHTWWSSYGSETPQLQSFAI